MAPRTPESLEAFFERLERQVGKGEIEVRFGQYHATHAVCLEDRVFRVRRLELSQEEAHAYLEEHGVFMPEHAEFLSKPGTLIHEVASLKDLKSWFKSQSWPF